MEQIKKELYLKREVSLFLDSSLFFNTYLNKS